MYLGHRVGSGVVEPETSKVSVVEYFPRPTTKKDVRAFLGLTGYHHRLSQTMSLFQLHYLI